MFKQIIKKSIILFLIISCLSVFAEGEDNSSTQTTDPEIINDVDTVNFKLESVNTLNLKELELKFNIDLDESSDTDFIILNNNNDLDEFNVEKATIKWKSIILLLDRELEKWQEYSLNVNLLKWLNWETIEAWINWLLTFYVDLETIDYNWNPSYFDWENIIVWKIKPILDENSNTSQLEDPKSWEIEPNIEDPELNSAESDIWGVELSDEDLNSASTIIDEADDLPQTGPEHWLLFLLASLITVWLFIRKFKKS